MTNQCGFHEIRLPNEQEQKLPRKTGISETKGLYRPSASLSAHSAKICGAIFSESSQIFQK
ncbi:MAG: hypothetical protein DWI02_11590 [Planctomycetota bacterium]|nr:MAG: hypothetical protein DWI02_11590 [Planctomycetota bacterium]